MHRTASDLAQGDVAGLIIYGKVRNLLIVDSVSNGVVKAHALIGQFPVYFSMDREFEFSGTHERRASVKDENLFVSKRAASDEIAPATFLPDVMTAAIRAIDSAMSGATVRDCGRIAAKHEQAISEVMDLINERHFEPQPELNFGM